MKFIPLGNHIIVKPIEEEKTSQILIPESVAEDRATVGKVIAIGPGRLIAKEREAVEVSKGDTILFEKFEHEEYIVDKERFLVVEFDRVIAIIK